METQIVRTVTFLAQYAQIIFKKFCIVGFLLVVSCHNLFLLGKRKPTQYLTLQEDHIISIYGIIFYFGPVGPNMEISTKAPQKGITSSLFLLKFNWRYGISKVVSLSIRRLKELNLCGSFSILD